MRTVHQIAEEIVTREGGFVNDPDDPGGATKFGVTLGTMRRLGLDLTGDGAIGIRDVRKLDRARAVDIFVTHYYRRPGIERMPGDLRASLFDMYVNAGSNAVKILQRLLVQMGYDVAVDGVIGPQTQEAATDAALPNGQILRDAYGVARRNYYFRLADARPSSRKFARSRKAGKGGWITRAEAFMSSKYHLTDRQFEERTAAWV